MNDSRGAGGRGERAELLSMLFGYFPAQALHVATRVGLADQPGPGPAAGRRNSPRPPAAITRRWSACCARWSSSASLDQPLPDDPDTFALTATGQLLRGDHPSSMRNYVLLFCGEQVLAVLGRPGVQRADRPVGLGTALRAAVRTRLHVPRSWTAGTWFSVSYSDRQHAGLHLRPGTHRGRVRRPAGGRGLRGPADRPVPAHRVQPHRGATRPRSGRVARMHDPGGPGAVRCVVHTALEPTHVSVWLQQ